MTSDHSPPFITPAEPWRRWVAAAVDVFLLFIGHTFLWFICVLLPASNWQDKITGVVSALAGWLYLLLFWALRSATPGQMAMEIAIVRYDGKPLTWGDAFRRLVGYLLAALPLHVGFLSIFWDRYRRGWHDHIARTVVIRRQPTQPLLPLPPPTTPPPAFVEEPVQPLAWHRWVLAGVFYVALAIGCTYPVVTRFSTHIAGDGGDAFHIMWSLWHAHEALINGRESLLITDSLFVPQQVDLLYYSACWAYAVPAALLLKWLTLTQTYNLLFLFSLCASAFIAFLLARALRCGFAESLLAGALFGFSPYLTAHGRAGHLELIALEFIALFALLCYQSFTRPSILWSLGAGVVLAIVGYGAWYYLVAAALMSFCLAVGVICQRKDIACLAVAQRLTVIGLCAGLCLSPLLVPMLKERADRSYMDMPLSITSAYSVDLAYAAFSNPLHPLWGKWVAEKIQGPEPIAGLSLIAVALSLVAAYRRWRQMMPWVLAGMTFLVLAFGPSLRVASRGLEIPAWLMLLGGGPPGNGLDSPFQAALSVGLAQQTLTQPGMLLSAKISPTLPFVWLRRSCPPIRPMRSPARFAVVTLLCVAVLAACGLRQVCDAAQHRWGHRGKQAIIMLGMALVVFEYLSVPFPMASTAVSDFYHQLATEPEPCVVVDVPIEDARQYNYYQTVHGKPLFFGFHSRVPPKALKFRDGNPLLSGLMSSGGYVVQRSLAAEEEFRTKPLTELRQQYAPSLRELAKVGGKYIILHKPMLTDAAVRQADRVLREALGLPLRWDDREIRVYEIRGMTSGER